MALIITGQNRDGLGVIQAYMLVATAAAVKGFQMDENGFNPKPCVKFRAELAIYKDQESRLTYGVMPLLREVIEFDHIDNGYLPDEAYAAIKANGIPGWTNLITEDFQ